MAVIKGIALCDDCMHTEICKVKSEVATYIENVMDVAGPIGVLALEVTCNHKLTPPIQRGGGGFAYAGGGNLERK